MAVAGPSRSLSRTMSTDYDLVAQLPSHQMTLDGRTLTRSKSTASERPTTLKRRPTTRRSAIDEADGPNDGERLC